MPHLDCVRVDRAGAGRKREALEGLATGYDCYGGEYQAAEL
jgi:hypothetical protein